MKYPENEKIRSSALAVLEIIHFILFIALLSYDDSTFVFFPSASLTAVWMFGDGDIDSSKRVIQVEKAIHLFLLSLSFSLSPHSWTNGRTMAIRTELTCFFFCFVLWSGNWFNPECVDAFCDSTSNCECWVIWTPSQSDQTFNISLESMVLESNKQITTDNRNQKKKWINSYSFVVNGFSGNPSFQGEYSCYGRTLTLSNYRIFVSFFMQIYCKCLPEFRWISWDRIKSGIVPETDVARNERRSVFFFH